MDEGAEPQQVKGAAGAAIEFDAAMNFGVFSLIRSLFIPLVWCALPLNAQFSNLATTNDGSVLLFTSRLTQSGTDQPDHGKVFIVDSRGVRQLLVRERQVSYGTGPFFPGGFTTNPYDLVAVSAAGDLSQLAVTGKRECSGYTSGLCVSSQVTTVYDASGGATFSGFGQMIVSRNGQWGLLREDRLTGTTEVRIVNRHTGQEFPALSSVFTSLNTSRQGIADDGTAVIALGDRVLVARPQRETETVSGLRASIAAIDAAGKSVVTSGAGLKLIRPDALPLKPIELSPTAGNAQISSDGKLILFHANGQASVIGPDGAGMRYVSAEPEGISDEVLSGNGEVVWLVTNSGRLLQVFLNSGAKREFIGAVPAVLGLPADSGDWWLSGSAAAGQPLTVTATVLNGERVQARINGVTAPVLSAQGQSLTIQIPWETPSGMHRIDLAAPNPSGWEGGVTRVTVRPVLPQFLRLFAGSTDSIIVHENFDALVTASNPARAGEIVHLYALGFGPVNPPVATGQTTPHSPLSRTTLALECSVAGDGRTVEVSFVGLAPDMIGIYQVDLRVPEVVNQGTARLTCDLPGWTALSEFNAIGRFFLNIPVN